MEMTKIDDMLNGENEFFSDYYEFTMIPKNSPIDNKTGVTIKGSSDEFVKAHKIIKSMTDKKGNRLTINGVDIAIMDTPKNKPIVIEIKAKNELSGKANLKFYEANKKGISTVMITKVSGSEFSHAKILAVKVIKYLIDDIVVGKLNANDIERLKKSINLNSKVSGCVVCGYSSQSLKDLQIHMSKVHKDGFTCTKCDKVYNEMNELKSHQVETHNEKSSSPESKRRKIDSEMAEVGVEENIERMDIDETNVALVTKLKEIPKKFDEIFKAGGIDRADYMIYEVKGDGACGANCVAAHFHKDQNLGPNVMTNVNRYLVKHWSFFSDYFTFPAEFMAGMAKFKVNNQDEFKQFLASERAKKMWIDHHGWQVVANIYQVSIHILTSRAVGELLEETEERWTHLEPDERLVEFSFVPKGLPDIWVIHKDEFHFDLLVPKDKEVINESKMMELKEALNKIVLEEDAPQVMEDQESMAAIAKELSKVKKEVQDLKEACNKTEKKAIESLKLEIKSLKSDFQKCMAALGQETKARIEAEAIVKVLKETIEAGKDLKLINNTEEMDIDEHVEVVEVEKVEIVKEKEENRDNKKKELKMYCVTCGLIFNSNENLKKHKNSQHQFTCRDCNLVFKSNSDLLNHCETHSLQNLYKCNKCERQFSLEEELKHHEKEHINLQTANRLSDTDSSKASKQNVDRQTSIEYYNCSKCDRKYKTMTELRRHDWRCHRNIECTICGDLLNSRQDITVHRQEKHRMFRKLICKFYPDCLDGDECLYQHGSKDDNSETFGCPKGEGCLDQSCSFSEKEHRNMSRPLCRFQGRCTREGCPFKHKVKPSAFLDKKMPITVNS